MTEAARLMPDVEMTGGAYEAAEGADVVVIVTEWDPFRARDFERLKSLMRRPVLVDLRNVYEPHAVQAHGFRYLGWDEALQPESSTAGAAAIDLADQRVVSGQGHPAETAALAPFNAATGFT